MRAMSKRGQGQDIEEITHLMVNLKRKIDQDLRMGAMYTIEYGANVTQDNIINIMNGYYADVESRVIYKLSDYYGLSNHYYI